VRKQLEDRASGGVTEQTKTSISVSDHDRKPKLTISAAASDRRAARAGVDRGGASGPITISFLINRLPIAGHPVKPRPGGAWLRAHPYVLWDRRQR
jgi:hypothetical protein